MKLHNKIIILAAVLLCLPNYLHAYDPLKDGKSVDEVFSAYQYYKDVAPNITVPRVVEVKFNTEPLSGPNNFAVYNQSTGEFEPSFFNERRVEIGRTIEGTGYATGSKLSNLEDNNLETYVDFPINTTLSSARINFTFDEPITSSSFYFNLLKNVSMPETVSVNAEVAGADIIVLSPVKPVSSNVNFPSTTSTKWKISFTYTQPLRIGEINFDGDNKPVGNRGLRFLAQPGQTYKIYFDSYNYAFTLPLKESADLISDRGVVYIDIPDYVNNPTYHPSDIDNDGIPDQKDNCENIFNMEQTDSDGNGIGDACEDYDKDGILGVVDNCPNNPNFSQEDTDKDGIGDACDTFDNRVTERLPWLPWAGIIVAGVTILGLFIIVVKHPKKDLNNLQ